MDPVLDQDLQLEILSHVAENMASRRATSTGGNLILAIEGQPGEGKSFHCKAVLGAAGVSITRFSLAEFESRAAGAPATRLVERYLDASEAIAAGQPAALVMEDVDLGFGPDRGNNVANETVQYTMNRDLLVAALMELCDSPRSVRLPEDSKRKDAGRTLFCQRVPVIMTGNSFGKVYRALLRHGRTRFIQWAPGLETRIQILLQLFPVLTLDSATSLVAKFSDEPVSFWSALALEVESTRVRSTIKVKLDEDPTTPFSDLVAAIDAIEEQEISIEVVEATGIALQQRRQTGGN